MVNLQVKYHWVKLFPFHVEVRHIELLHTIYMVAVAYSTPTANNNYQTKFPRISILQ